MTQITRPKAGDDVLHLWKTVDECVKAVNALQNCSINPKGTKNKLTITESNATLELNKADLGGGDGGDGDALPEATVQFIVNGQVQSWGINGEPA